MVRFFPPQHVHVQVAPGFVGKALEKLFHQSDAETLATAQFHIGNLAPAFGLEHEQGRGMGTEFPRPRQPDLLNTNFVRRLDDALKLTADQRSAIAKIIAEGQDQNHSIWTNNAEQMRKVMQDVRHRVREQLTPDQQKQFDELMRRAPQRHGMTNAPPGWPQASVPSATTNAPGA